MFCSNTTQFTSFISLFCPNERVPVGVILFSCNRLSVAISIHGIALTPNSFPSFFDFFSFFFHFSIFTFQTVSVTVSVLTLTFISIDRWYAICFPLRYVSTNGRAWCSIAIIWIAALLSGKKSNEYCLNVHQRHILCVFLYLHGR